MIIQGYQLMHDEVLRNQLSSLVLNSLSGLPLIPTIFTMRNEDGSFQEGPGIQRIKTVIAQKYKARPGSDFKVYTKAEDDDRLLYLEFLDEDGDTITLTMNVFQK